ncbi:MAG: LacI family DNA-binding transcriptional regulator [Kangiellaceae bacterium]
MKKVTINDVAKHAGVSKKTISRVLNNESNVSTDTKEKVLRSFEILGYRPNPQARGLATNQSYLIGLLYDNPNKSYVTDIQTGALETCQKENYNLVIYPEQHDAIDLLDRLRSLLNNAHLDGLILTPPFSDMKPILEMLEQLQVNYVRIAPTEDFERSPCVVSNDLDAAYQMTRYLISLGHSKIAFIKGHPEHNVSELRLNGYLKAMQEASIESQPEFIEQGYFTFRSGEDCGRRLLNLKNPPSAIFSSNDFIAAGVLKVAAQRSVSVPHQLSVCGFDNAPISRYIWPSLTTVKQPIKSMAAEGVKLLIQSIRQKPIEFGISRFEDELIVRESSAPVANF